MSQSTRAIRCSVRLLAALAILLLLGVPSSSATVALPGSVLPRTAGRALLQNGIACVLSKCLKQYTACQASPTCFPGVICANNCFASTNPDEYVACIAKCIYTYQYGDAASAGINRCILGKKCAKPKFANPTCPPVKKSPFSVSALRGKYSVVLGGSVADREPTKYIFAGASITTIVRPTYLNPARSIKFTSKRTKRNNGATYKATVVGLSLANSFNILAASAKRKYLVLGTCGVDTGAVSVLVLSASGAPPSAAVAKKLAAGLSASGWASKYPYKKLVKVATF